jgi:hypothetical protein
MRMKLSRVARALLAYHSIELPESTESTESPTGGLQHFLGGGTLAPSGLRERLGGKHPPWMEL